MFGQLIFGVSFESTVGMTRIIILYIVTGIGGNIFSCLIIPNSLSVGASTAIAGIFGGYLG